MRRVLTPRWVAVHVLTAGAVAFMLWLASWQLSRGMSGNMISWGYAFQWPAFAGFAVFVWAREVRRALHPDPPAPARPDRAAAGPAAAGPADTGPANTSPTGVDPVEASATHPADPTAAPSRRPVITRRAAAPEVTDDPELIAYNQLLAWLNANPGARPADYPG